MAGTSLVARLLLRMIGVYRRWVSPLLPPSCRFVPSCSAYAQEAVGREGAVRGLWLAIRRLSRCHPLGGKGYDPVPQQVAATHTGSCAGSGHGTGKCSRQGRDSG